jgi:hypothetical protein
MPKARQGKQKPRRPRKSAGGQTTGDVATILEAKYHVMEIFYEVNEQAIADDLAEAMAGSLENLLMGARPTEEPFAAGLADLETRFKQWLEQKGMDDTGTPGVPTKASLMGVSHRFKTKRGPARPSFIDTGLYESAFKAWTEGG